MATLKLQWDSRDLKFWRGGKVEKALAKALKKAGGDAIRAMKAASSRELRQRKNLKASRISKGLRISFPKSKEISGLVWTMEVSGDPLRVSDFPHKQTRRGVNVRINKGNMKLIGGAFVAAMKSGHKGVFVRRGKKRLPIEELFTSRLTDVFKDADMIPTVQERAQSVFSKSLDRLLPIELDRLK